MHELSLALDLVAAVERNIVPGDERVVRVVVTVGAATGIEPESLRLAFRVVAAGTPADGAELTVTRSPARCWCIDCGTLFDSEDIVGRCPECGRLGGKMLSGDEVMLQAIEVADV